MKILFLHRWVGVHEGGTETDIKNLVAYLDDRGHQVGIITSRGDALISLLQEHPNIKVWYLPLAWGESKYSYDSMYDPRLYFYTAIFALRVFLKVSSFVLFGHFRPDVISTHFITEAMSAWLIRFLFRIPYVFVLEGYTDLEARVARWANLQFSCSQHDIAKCYQKFGYRPIHRWFGVDTARFTPRGKDFRDRYFSRNDFVVLSLCRLEPRKNLGVLIKAANITKEQCGSIKYLIVGEGVQAEDLHSQVSQLGLQDTVKFAGRASEEDLPAFYRTGDIYVLPTRYEGFGIVFIEAMASGLPIISTTAGAVPEVVGEAGILLDPDDSSAFAQEIIKLYRTPEERERLRAKGFQLVKDKYDAKMLMGIYEKNLVKLIS